MGEETVDVTVYYSDYSSTNLEYALSQTLSIYFSNSFCIFDE